MRPSQRFLDQMTREGVDTRRRSEVDAWIEAWADGGFK